MNKLILKLENNWLEATWTESTETESAVIHCESYSGHKEHITMLRAKAKEYNTSLKEYEPLIKQCQDAFFYPSEEEIKQQEQANLNQESLNNLSSTDWKVIRELERLYLKGTDLNIERELLRESIK